jgi:hypothetical protein
MEYPLVATILAAEETEAKKLFDATPEKPFMYVWRMEDAQGRGPYRDQESWTNEFHGSAWDKNPTKHPEPNNDKGFDRKDLDTLNGLWGDVLFGFQNESDIARWFTPEELVSLEKAGFKAKKVKAKEVWGSGKQVFFMPYDEEQYLEVAKVLANSGIKAYHGGNTPIKKFDRRFSAQGVFWFSENKDKILKGESGASSTKYLMEVTLNVKKPAGWPEYEKLGLGQIKEMGYDSIHLGDDWVVFDSKNIKVDKVEDLQKYPTVEKATSEYVSQRALAKATLPEDSELMEFYYLADRGGWSEQVREEGELEWDRMDEKERREVIPDLISHGYSNHFPHDPKTEQDWREVKDYFLSYWEDMAEENSNQSTELFFEDAKIIKNPTLVRFTDRPPEGGTFHGYGPTNLGLTFHYRPSEGDLAFAFDLKDYPPDEWKNLSSKYGSHAFRFKVPYAVKAYHVTDGEYQVVFDVNTVKDLKEVKLVPKSKRGVPL